VAVRKTIHLVDLLIDAQNPRLADEPPNQREAIRAVAAHQNEKLAALAVDIVEHGINLSDSPIVVPSSEQPERYTVLEGNRRLTAIKALENPELIAGTVDDRVLRRFKNLNERYQKNPIVHVDCVVFDHRSEADHWIELRHTGENEGAGIVRWGGVETARFKQRRGEKIYHLQALDFLEERGDLSSEERQDVPITSLERLLSSPYIRSKLGLEMEDRILYTQFDEDEVAKGLLYVVRDLITGQAKTGDIYYKEDRIKYIDQIDEANLPDTSNPSDTIRPLVSSLASEEKQPQASPKRSYPSSKKRKRLIPPGFVLEIDQPRINDVYLELKKLSVENYPNAVSVLFRVFLELSLDDYIERSKLGVHENSKLAIKLEKVGENLYNANMIAEQQFKAVRRAAQGDQFLASTVTTMHQYVHNPHFTPAPSDLRAAWDNLSDFVKAMWEI
jgi:hypothetical protein